MLSDDDTQSSPQDRLAPLPEKFAVYTQLPVLTPARLYSPEGPESVDEGSDVSTRKETCEEVPQSYHPLGTGKRLPVQALPAVSQALTTAM